MASHKMRSLAKRVEKYLSKFSHLDKWNFQEIPNGKFKYAIVIPALNEPGNIPLLLESIKKNSVENRDDFLIVVVINNNDNADLETKLGNQKTFEYLRRLKGNFPFRIELIDAFSEGKAMPVKTGGVGLARKIGLDAALQMLDLDNHSGLVCLDADCTVTENYLETIGNAFSDESFHAGYFNFEHRSANSLEIRKAIICYEIFLRYYVAALKFARSPFAFHTIGSTMIFDYEAYIYAGGMNKRKAGEDFYFLEKVSKMFEVHKIKEATVYPSARASLRVPFGTGQRVHRFAIVGEQKYSVYSPKSFTVLKKWNTLFLNGDKKEGKYYLRKAEEISGTLKDFLRLNRFEEKWEGIIKNSVSEQQVLRQKIFWFDAFKTLKLIHFLREKEFPDVNMFEGVNALFELKGLPPFPIKEKIPPLEKQIEFLTRLRQID